MALLLMPDKIVGPREDYIACHFLSLSYLTVGKDATMFVADGDILETPTLVNMAFVQGRCVSLNDRLYDKFRQNYDRHVITNSK